MNGMPPIRVGPSQGAPAPRRGGRILAVAAGGITAALAAFVLFLWYLGGPEGEAAMATAEAAPSGPGGSAGTIAAAVAGSPSAGAAAEAMARPTGRAANAEDDPGPERDSADDTAGPEGELDDPERVSDKTGIEGLDGDAPGDKSSKNGRRAAGRGGTSGAGPGAAEAGVNPAAAALLARGPGGRGAAAGASGSLALSPSGGAGGSRPPGPAGFADRVAEGARRLAAGLGRSRTPVIPSTLSMPSAPGSHGGKSALTGSRPLGGTPGFGPSGGAGTGPAVGPGGTGTIGDSGDGGRIGPGGDGGTGPGIIVDPGPGPNDPGPGDPGPKPPPGPPATPQQIQAKVDEASRESEAMGRDAIKPGVDALTVMVRRYQPKVTAARRDAEALERAVAPALSDFPAVRPALEELTAALSRDRKDPRSGETVLSVLTRLRSMEKDLKAAERCLPKLSRMAARRGKGTRDDKRHDEAWQCAKHAAGGLSGRYTLAIDLAAIDSELDAKGAALVASMAADPRGQAKLRNHLGRMRGPSERAVRALKDGPWDLVGAQARKKARWFQDRIRQRNAEVGKLSQAVGTLNLPQVPAREAALESFKSATLTLDTAARAEDNLGALDTQGLTDNYSNGMARALVSVLEAQDHLDAAADRLVEIKEKGYKAKSR